jgi:hypothetical protein
LYHHILDKICVRGPKLSKFKIRGSILQNDKNRGPKLQSSLLYFQSTLVIYPRLFIYLFILYNALVYDGV